MRLNNQIRDNILSKAMSNVPSVDYISLLVPVVQKVIYDSLPEVLQKAYDDENCRKYMKSSQVCFKKGNNSAIYTNSSNGAVYGVTAEPYSNLTIRCDDASFEHYSKNSLNYKLSKAVRDSGFLDKHYEQTQLIKNVQMRLSATLKSVSTIKRLYDVLEPELHHLIPKEDAKTANLPASAAPVVDDLRRLGAELPEVAKKS